MVAGRRMGGFFNWLAASARAPIGGRIAGDVGERPPRNRLRTAGGGGHLFGMGARLFAVHCRRINLRRIASRRFAGGVGGAAVCHCAGDGRAVLWNRPANCAGGGFCFLSSIFLLRRLGALGGDIAGEFVGAPLGEFGVGGFSRRRYFCIADGDFGAFHHRFVVARTAALSAGGRGGGFGIRRIRAVAAMMWLPLGGRGLSDAFMRHVLSLGVPMEEWVARLARLAETESDADSLLAGAMRELSSLPAIAGVRWLAADGKEKSVGDIKSPYRAEIHIAPIHAVVHSHRPVGPSARLSYSLLMRVAAEYYLSKLREERASRDNLARAVYETGARLTHDIKNILQAMQGLIALARGGDEKGVAVVRRQLPELARRLAVTLEKIKSPRRRRNHRPPPGKFVVGRSPKRRADSPARFILSGDAIADCAVPAALFDRALDNLLENALAKKTENGDLEVTAEFHCDEKGASLRVADNGDAVAEATANLLFKSPLNSETGLGIGLFHLSRQAENAALRRCWRKIVREELFSLCAPLPKSRFGKITNQIFRRIVNSGFGNYPIRPSE